MSIRDRAARERRRAWEMLSAVEDHPQVKEWLEEATAVHAHERRRFRWLSAAAALVLALGTGIGAYLMHSTGTQYQTHVGEQRDVILPDGSMVTLNTNTALNVRYSQKRRYLVLERGEALFSVKHDTARPFEVAAGDTLTRALGTEFNVDLRQTTVTVSVLEGAVRVAAANVAPSRADDEPSLLPIAALAKGQALEFDRKQRRAQEEQADVRRIDAWRTRRLEFNDTPLGEALAELNRYSTTQIIAGTPELAAVRVSGVFRIGDHDGFLFSLREALHVETHASAEEVILVRAAQ